MDINTYLHQEKQWMAKGGYIRISDMDAQHRVRSARWLIQQSTTFYLLVLSGLNEGALSGEQNFQQIMSLVAQTPQSWIKGVPLMKALLGEMSINAFIEMPGDGSPKRDMRPVRARRGVSRG